MLVVQLLKNVLDLSFELFINLVHQVLEYFWHCKLFSLLSKFLPGEYRIQCTIYVCPHLQVVMLYKLIQDVEQADIGIFTFILTTRSK